MLVNTNVSWADCFFTGGVGVMKSIVALLLFVCAVSHLEAEEYWLFAGQSNMNWRIQSKSAFAVLAKEQGEVQRTVLSSQKDGKSIDYWHPGNRGAEMIDEVFGVLHELTAEWLCLATGRSKSTRLAYLSC